MQYGPYNRLILYRASSCVIDISFVEDDWCLLDEESTSSEFFPIRKLGSLGSGSKLSLPNIITTNDMLGLSSGSCCTHKGLTWMQRNISGRVQELSEHISISSKGLDSLHNFHA